MGSFISSIGTATPSHKYTQTDLVNFMLNAHGVVNGSEVKLKALYRATGIKYRYSVLEDYGKEADNFSFYPKNSNLEPFPDTASRMGVYKEEALKLSLDAAKNCLSGLDGYDTNKITHVITVSCTGFYAPGLDIDLIHELKLNKNIHRTAINYMGCYAAISALRAADSMVRANSEASVLIVCVELCSLHFQKNDTLDNRLANALFGDGAGAMLVEGNNNPSQIQLNPVAFYSDILPNGSEDMAWSIGNLGFEMKLSAYIPDVIKAGVKDLGKALLAKIDPLADLSRIKYFAIHPGGKKILEAIEDEMGISKEDNRFAYHVLNNYGNMSSPTIVFVLNELSKHLTREDHDEYIFCMAFGPGLTLESSLLKVVANG
jgi:predicted naringenin-chalcone synthase